MTLLLQHRFDVAYVNSYSSRPAALLSRVHLLGGARGLVPSLVFLGLAHRLFVWRSAKEQEAPS